MQTIVLLINIYLETVAKMSTEELLPQTTD